MLCIRYLHCIVGILDHSKTLSKEFNYIPYWFKFLTPNQI